MQLIRDNLTLWTSELEEGENWFQGALIDSSSYI
jgi:hypothetical protein